MTNDDQPESLVMTEKGIAHGTYSAFRAAGWTDEQMVTQGYAKCAPGLAEIVQNVKRGAMSVFQSQIEKWLVECRREGYVITIEQSPHDVVTVREVRE